MQFREDTRTILQLIEQRSETRVIVIVGNIYVDKLFETAPWWLGTQANAPHVSAQQTPLILL